jgi:hypothetical protein
MHSKLEPTEKSHRRGGVRDNICADVVTRDNALSSKVVLEKHIDPRIMETVVVFVVLPCVISKSGCFRIGLLVVVHIIIQSVVRLVEHF